MVEKTHAAETAKIDKQKTHEDDHLWILEKVKKQDEEYAKISDLYNLPSGLNDAQVSYQPPGREHPLTSNTIHLD